MKKIFLTMGMIAALAAVALTGCGDRDDGMITSDHYNTTEYATTVPNTENMLESDITELSTELASGATELSSRLAEGATDLSEALRP